MSASPRRSRAEMIAETTAKLIAAARRSFATVGYAETSMDALCAEAGLTRGALYHHFGGKEGLLEAVVRDMDREIGERLERHYETLADGWEAFRSCCLLYLDFAREPEIQRIVLKDAPAVLGRRLWEIDEESSIGPMVESLRQLQADGRLRHGDPEAMARLLNGALINAALWIASDPDPARAHAGAIAAFDQLLDGLRRG